MLGSIAEQEVVRSQRFRVHWVGADVRDGPAVDQMFHAGVTAFRVLMQDD